MSIPNIENTHYSLFRLLKHTSFDEAVSKVTEALKTEGFGVLSTIDVKSTMKEKLDKDERNYIILGACHPALAHMALSEEPAIGVLMPCNVVVAQNDNGIGLSIIDPVPLFTILGRDDLDDFAQDVADRLKRVLASV